MTDRPTSSSAPQVNDSHGQSIASWTAVGVLLVGSVILAVAVIFANWFWIAVGVAFLVAGPVVGIAMSKAGYGAGGARDSFTNSPHHH